MIASIYCRKKKNRCILFFICTAISNNGLLITKVFYIMLSQLLSFIIPLTYCLLYHITLSSYKESILLNACHKLVHFVIYVPSHFNATFKRKKYFYIFHFVKAKTSGQSPALTSSRAPRVMVLKFCFFLFFFFFYVFSFSLSFFQICIIPIG